MSEEKKALEEKNLGQEAYKRKEYDVAISHYSNATRLNPKEMTFIYHIAKIHLEQKNYAESIRFSTKAIKVGKEEKANVKMVAKAMAMRGRAHKGRGETDKFEEDIGKAVKFLKAIAQVKFDKERWAECIEFCERAYEMAEENGFADEEILVLMKKAMTKNLMDGFDQGCNKAKRAAELKKLGNEAYNKRDFDTALKYYNDALNLDPPVAYQITFLNNIAAVKLEQGAYAECIEFCTKAIDIGQENGAEPPSGIVEIDSHPRAIELMENEEALVKAQIEKALNRRDRAQKLLDSASEVTKQLQNGAPLPEVYEKGIFEDDILLYFRSNWLDMFNMTDLYNVSLKLYEKRNFTGCISLCQHAEDCGNDGRMLAKVRALLSKAQRRDYRFDEDLDAKLAEHGGRQDSVTVEMVQGIMTNMCAGKVTCRPQDAALWISMADINGDRKVSYDQFMLVYRAMQMQARAALAKKD